MPRPISPLFDRWLSVRGCAGGATAVTVAETGETLTFDQLAARIEPEVAGGPVVAEARGVSFLTQTLRAWRDAVPLLPVETGAAIGDGFLDDLPAGTAHVKLTSGTTGEPRAVLFTAEQLAADAAQIVSTMELHDYGSNVGAISLAHSYGFSNLVLPLLLHGVPLVLAESPLPAAVDAALDLAGDGAVLPAVPAMWRAWAAAGIVSAERVGLAISAGAPLPAALEASVYGDHGLKIHNFLGSSECGGIAFDRTALPRADGEMVGTAMDGVGVTVGEGGVLTVSGAAVGTGYWPRDRPEVLGAGKFVSGDLAEIDSSGGIRLLGRSGDTINVAGRKVSPAEVEAVLEQCEGVDCCVVFGVPSPDAERHEEIVACVSGDAGEAALRAAAGAGLVAWKVPRHWWCCGELAPDARGKISRRGWRERFLNRR